MDPNYENDDKWFWKDAVVKANVVDLCLKITVSFEIDTVVPLHVVIARSELTNKPEECTVRNSPHPRWNWALVKRALMGK